MTFGPGRSGKTLVLRWLAERALERNVEINLATVDAARPALKLFFPEVIAPGAPERVTFWLERMISRLMSAPRHVAIDFGADMTLEPILRQAPNLTEMLEDAGIAAVALYLLTPRSLDLTVLDRMVEAGFKPPATALILNLGAADPARDPEQEFAQIRKHSAYRAALDRGAVEVWMPRLYAAKAIEDRFMSLHRAATAEGGLSLWDQTRAFNWLQQMEAAFAPCLTWLP
jgi:hypothetical protein